MILRFALDYAACGKDSDGVEEMVREELAGEFACLGEERYDERWWREARHGRNR
jgi:hypothetical protein